MRWVRDGWSVVYACVYDEIVKRCVSHKVRQAWSLAAEGLRYPRQPADGIGAVCPHSSCSGRGRGFHRAFHSTTGRLGAPESSNWRTDGMLYVLPCIRQEIKWFWNMIHRESRWRLVVIWGRLGICKVKSFITVADQLGNLLFRVHSSAWDTQLNQ